MERALKASLNTATLTRTGQSGGGCINQGEAYITDNGTVFVKSNKRSKEGKIAFKKCQVRRTIKKEEGRVTCSSVTGKAVDDDSAMEQSIKKTLNTSKLEKLGQSGGGSISRGEAYIIDNGVVFIKENKLLKSRLMFEGEFEGLSAIAATNTVAVPKPLKVLDNPVGGACFVMEFLEMKGLRRFSQQLGENLAKLHLHNESLRVAKDPLYVKEFGFPTATCCGYIPQDNTWNEDWVSFFAKNRLDYQFKLLEKEIGDREALELWSRLQIILPTFFKDLEIKPSLLHGDLWGGNAAETKTNPVIFDPAAFYGHHEYDLAIAGMFGGFNRSFYDAYHKHIPKAPGFENRHKLYQLFHYLNHWNHFGSGYRDSSISTMKSLLK